MYPLIVYLLIGGIINVIILSVLLSPTCKHNRRNRRTRNGKTQTNSTQFSFHIHNHKSSAIFLGQY